MKIVDLTLGITSDMITFPGYPMPNFIEWSKFDIQGYISEVMFLSTHTGTHMDAPFHFNPNGQTIDQVEVNRYIRNNPGLSKGAAEYLVEKKINAVGIDCPSIDIGIDSGLIAHKMLLSNQILVIENLCNLFRFKNEKFTLLVTPLKLAGASGSPIRAIGIEE